MNMIRTEHFTELLKKIIPERERERDSVHLLEMT